MFSEKQKDFLLVLAVILYITSISVLTIMVRTSSSSMSDLGVYYENTPGQAAKHPIPSYQVYFLISNDIRSFGLAACMLPSLAFCALIHVKGGRRALLLAAVALPFLLLWDAMSQNISVLFFIFAIALKDRKKTSLVLFILGCLSHRMGIYLGAMILTAYALPFERIKHLVDKSKTLALAGMGAILIISLFYHCGVFATFSRSFILIGLWLWASFKSDDSHMSALFIMVIIGGILTQSEIDGNRIFFMLQPLTVMGMALEKKQANVYLLMFLLVVGNALIAFNLLENQNKNFTGMNSEEQGECKGIDVPAAIGRIIDYSQSRLKT